jgi:LacI family transcriptional regulator
MVSIIKKASNENKEIKLSPKHTVTIRDIAKTCGVGKTTVSAAIYGNGHVNEKTREEILRVAKEMGYDPNQQMSARRLGMRKSNNKILNHTIGLFSSLNVTEGSYIGKPYQGIAEVCTKENFAILLTNIPEHTIRTDPTYELPGTFSRGDADGAIMFGSQRKLVDILRATSGFANRPIVSLFYEEENTSSIISDDKQGTLCAMRHLLKQGHRNILHLYTPEHSNITRMRISGIITAFTEMNLDPAKHIHCIELPSELMNPIKAPHVLPQDDGPGQDITLGAEIIMPFLQAHPEITAILCENDAMALNLWHMLHNIGIKVPRDISLIGFDDTDGMMDAAGTNHLTTIRLPLYDMGRVATELLLQRITGQITEDEQRILPVEFILRYSTAPPHR